MTPEITGLLDKARQSVEAAQALLADNYVDFAASRAYYAMFYALEALLLTKNLSFSKHSAVISAFGKEYIKTGMFDPRLHRSVIEAFDLRNAGDYGTMHAVSEELASQTIQSARDLIQAVSSHIDNAQRPNGFTLVELAVSLVVIGLLIGLGTAMVGPLMNAIKVRESRENLGAAVESVNGWAAGNNRLPDNSTANSYSFASVVRTPADAWGRNFIYLYDNNLVSGTITKDTICGRKTTPITVRQCLTANCATTPGTDYVDTPNVAYIVLSQGDDALTDTKIGVTPITSGSITAATTVTANTSDDLVRWVTLDELRTKVGCQGPQLRIVNNELPYGYESSPYLIKLYRDGGGGTYSWCWTGSLPNGVKLYDKETATQTEITVSADCSLTTGTWVAENATERPVIQGTPTATPQTRGTYNQTLYVKDSQDNISYKQFVLTINP